MIHAYLGAVFSAAIVTSAELLIYFTYLTMTSPDGTAANNLGSFFLVGGILFPFACTLFIIVFATPFLVFVNLANEQISRSPTWLIIAGILNGAVVCIWTMSQLWIPKTIDFQFKIYMLGLLFGGLQGGCAGYTYFRLVKGVNSASERG